MSVPLMTQPTQRKLPASLLSSVGILNFPGQIYYCDQRDDCNFICLELNNRSLKTGLCLGFDLEWKVQYQAGLGASNTALIQICPSKECCYLFHLAAMSGFPTELAKLLENERIIKVGVGIQGDAARLKLEANVSLCGMIDLAEMGRRVLRVEENWSLEGLLRHLIAKRLDKSPRLRCSNWECYPLSEQQKLYAATDAYAGLLIYQSLLARERGVKQ